MTALRALARREVLSALRSPRYYILLGFYAFVQGYLFCILFLDDGAMAFRQLTREAAFLLLLAAPLLTAGSLAGEGDSGELRTLLAEPVDERTIVGGKALGSLVLLLPLPLMSLIPAIGAHLAAGADLAPMATAVAGLVLVAGACAAAGIFTSSFASHPAAAAVSALGLLLGLGFLGVQTARVEESVSFLLGGSGPGALNPFWLADFLFRGVLDTRPLVLFPAAALLFLHLAVVVLRSRRMGFGEREAAPGGPGRSRAVLVALHLAWASMPALLLFGAVHMVNVRVHGSWDLSGYLTLSGPTTRLLAALPEPARIYRVPQRSGARDRLADLLDEMARVARGRVVLDTWTPAVHQGELRPLGLLVRPADGVVVRLGGRVQALGMANLDVESRDAERAVLDALETMLPSVVPPAVVLTEGHGERTLPMLRRLLASEGLASVTLDLGSAGATLPSTALLAMVGPRTDPTPAEVALIGSHLAAGGPLLLCMDPDAPGAGLSVAALVGVTAGAGVVEDSSRSLAGAGASSLLVSPAAGHPVTDIIGRLTLVLPGSLSLTPVLPVEDPLRRILLATGAASRVVPPGTAGPHVLAFSVEGPRVAGAFRAVVTGDADFLDDRLLGYETNAAFAAALITWLARRPPPSAIPREPYAARPVLGRAGARIMLWTVAVLPAILWLALGFVAWRAYQTRVAGRVAT